MPETGDNVAAEFGISREQADLFAAQSQAKYQKAKEEGFFADEITPIEVFQGKKLPPKFVSEDEHPRPSSTVEALTKLKPLFEGGVVTAGNASGINDGAAALLIGSEAAGQKYGLKPMAKSYQRRLQVLSHALWVQVRSKPLKSGCTCWPYFR